MATLSHDLAIEILRGLSVKDLLRFQCVSKLWCSSINDSYFIKLHLSYSLKTNINHSLILRKCGYDFVSVNYDSPKTTQRLNHPLDFSSASSFFPRSTYYGFGYDPISDDYKLVRMVQLHGNNKGYLHSEAKVYSLRSNCWRRIKDFCFYLILHRKFGILANNALHWMVFKTPQSWKQNLVGFDLGTEEFRFLELPDLCLDKLFCYDIKAMGGYNCLTATFRDSNDVVAEVWIMKEYGVKESWVKLISWNQPHLLTCFPSVVVVPLAFSKNGDKVLFSSDVHTVQS
ncbi:hypothetical protein Gotur_005376 [Gossypium turneri]